MRMMTAAMVVPIAAVANVAKTAVTIVNVVEGAAVEQNILCGDAIYLCNCIGAGH